MKIFVNAGHGGKDSGAISGNGTKEKDITRKIASFLVQKLTSNGYNVEFFQQKNNLKEVILKENTSETDFFISIHCNSANNKIANGVEAFFYSTSKIGKLASNVIVKSIASKLKIKNRGVKAKNELMVLNSTKAPAVLLELAFLSNEIEEKMLINSSEVFADAIMEGIMEWEM